MFASGEHTNIKLKSVFSKLVVINLLPTRPSIGEPIF
jgi:hypothetical protein